MVNFYTKLSNLLTNVRKCDIVGSGDSLSVFNNIKTALVKSTEMSHVLPNVDIFLTVDTHAVGVKAV